MVIERTISHLRKPNRMTRNDDERQFILYEWEKWAPEHLPAARNGIGSGTDAIRFFTILQIERPRLLQFRTLSANPWQTVHSWLKQSRKVLGGSIA